MICADFLAGAHLDNGNPEILLNSISRYYKFLPGERQQASLKTCVRSIVTCPAKTPSLRLAQELYEQAASRHQRLSRTCYLFAWRIEKL